MSDQLSNNNPNLKLARKIGLIREQGKSLSELDDFLIQQLVKYKKKIYERIDPDSAEKQAVWNNIESATKPAKTSVLTLFNSTAMRWAAAAAIMLIATIFSFVIYHFYQQPTLLAKSESAIKTVQLSDGSSVTLRPYSKLYGIDNKSSLKTYRLQGEGYFKVMPSPNRTFVVETETGRVSVLGTRFILSSWGQQMQVYLEEGSVKVEALEQDSSVVIKPGESASVSDKKAIPFVNVSPSREFLDWIDRQLIFKDKAAEQIVRELEQQFNIKITLPPETAGTILTGQLSLKNMQTSLDDLELVLGGKFSKAADRFYIFEEN